MFHDTLAHDMRTGTTRLQPETDIREDFAFTWLAERQLNDLLNRRAVNKFGLKLHKLTKHIRQATLEMCEEMERWRREQAEAAAKEAAEAASLELRYLAHLKRLSGDPDWLDKSKAAFLKRRDARNQKLRSEAQSGNGL